MAFMRGRPQEKLIYFYIIIYIQTANHSPYSLRNNTNAKQIAHSTYLCSPLFQYHQ